MVRIFFPNFVAPNKNTQSAILTLRQKSPNILAKNILFICQNDLLN